ncbi:Holliday junction branch migration protein RuvA [Dorea acetigenes]|uniref:Holliday junction branch migration complex subunit RuvA n=1 Tax=Dorea acetigenes TaxID=2981787 RepID=A0ABT2RJ53_9FIRM|nr:Holliday junction branch migration protein RuvA [Dorea acetigenes]MCU6685428.1 Holliday junction branch migration protein RuvA [Dorea acetigenes]SCI51838.1 Holliday junction ATP-dependent DNA helicase RuvA [uncultured Clostridium sp.]
MISYIRGELADVEENKVIVDAGGIGYGIFMSGHAIGLLPRVGSEVKIYTYLNVKEDCMQLFGFLTRDELSVFRLLITVNGIGPKGGLGILSKLTPDELRFAVMAGDVKLISSAPGIGRKTAEKLILELKDKLSIEDVLERQTSEDGQIMGAEDSEVQQEAVQALTALGYGNAESLKAVRQVELADGMTTEDVLKQALKYMMF